MRWIVVLLAISGCNGCNNEGKNGNGKTPDGPGEAPGLIRSDPILVYVELPDIFQNISVPNTPGPGIPFTMEMPAAAAGLIEIAEARVDMDATAAEAGFMPDPGEPASGELDAGLRIGGAGEHGTVCDQGSDQGSATFAYSGNGFDSADPPSIDATEEAISAMNDGEFTACAYSDSPVTGTATIPALWFEYTLGTDCDEAPAQLAGLYIGDYFCDSLCLGYGKTYREEGTVEITIEQDGAKATYTDEVGASYAGIVCGNTFSFSGGDGNPLGSDYVESGALTLNPDGTISKRSFWRSGLCGGECFDDNLEPQ